MNDEDFAKLQDVLNYVKENDLRTVVDALAGYQNFPPLNSQLHFQFKMLQTFLLEKNICNTLDTTGIDGFMSLFIGTNGEEILAKGLTVKEWYTKYKEKDRLIKDSFLISKRTLYWTIAAVFLAIITILISILTAHHLI